MYVISLDNKAAKKLSEDSVDRNTDFRLAKISFQVLLQQQTFNPLTQIFPTPLS